MLNVAQIDVDPMNNLFEENNVRAEPLFSMTRGRVIAINGEPIVVKDRLGVEESAKSKRGARGPRFSSNRNLTWAQYLPNGNRVIDGLWWDLNYSGPPLVSIENSMAERGGVKVGDTLDFKIQDQIF